MIQASPMLSDSFRPRVLTEPATLRKSLLNYSDSSSSLRDSSSMRSRAPGRRRARHTSAYANTYLRHLTKSTATNTIAAQMKKRRRELRRKRHAQKSATKVGPVASFSSYWTLHQLIRESHKLGQANTNSMSTPVPTEMIYSERALEMRKHQMWEQCHQQKEKISDEMDVSMVMLPPEFLFQHNLHHHARERSLVATMAALRRLVSAVKAGAWDRWMQFVYHARRVEQRDRMELFRKRRGQELLRQIGQRIFFAQLYRGFSTWRRVLRRMKRARAGQMATTIQRWWRGHHSRKLTRRLVRMHELNLRLVLFVEWAERQWRVRRAKERALLQNQHGAAIKITAFLRIVGSMRIAELRRQEIQREREYRLLCERMAMRVQCAWRCRQGRFSLYLRRRALQMVEEEREFAAVDIQRVWRGFAGRLIGYDIMEQRRREQRAVQYLRQMLHRQLALAYRSWSSHTRKMVGMRCMLRRGLMGCKQQHFEKWHNYVEHVQKTRLAHEKRLEELRRAELRRQRHEEENRRKVKAALAKMFHRYLVLSFNSWQLYANTMRRAREMALSHLVAHERQMFQRWLMYIRELKHERELERQRAELERRRREAEELAAEKERQRKLRWSLNRIRMKSMASSFGTWCEMVQQNKRLKGMMLRALQGEKRRRFDRWWEAVCESREHFNTSSVFLKRLLNRRLYAAFLSWAEYYRRMVRVRARFARAMMRDKHLRFELWSEFTLESISIRALRTLQEVQMRRKRLVGLSRAMNTVVQQIMMTEIPDMSRDDVRVLQRAVRLIGSHQEVEERCVIRVQSSWRAHKGRLAYHLKMQAKRIREAEEFAASQRLQKLIRGHQGRRRSLMLKEQRQKEELRQQYLRERRQKEEREKWLREAEETTLRETLLLKRKQEMELEKARMRAEMARLQAEEAKYREEELQRKKREREMAELQQRADHVAQFGGWTEVPDIATGAVYYYNELTGASQWERPPELGGGADDDDPEKAWIELPHGSGQSYWYNTITKESTWDDPRVAQVRVPKQKKRFCQGPGCAHTESPKLAVRECPKCEKDFCMQCHVQEHRSRRKADHRFKPIVHKAVKGLACRDCDSVATRWCKECDANFCDNCWAWAHQAGTLALHQSINFIRGAPVCIECQNRVAVRTCQQCGDPFCEKCYDQQHRSGTKARHNWMPLEVFKETLKDDEEYCAICEVRAADRMCDPCNEQYCERCFKETHTGPKTEHNWTAWSKIKTGKDWVEINDEATGATLYFNVKTKQTTDKRPVGLMTGKQRDQEKKRRMAEREMQSRLDKEREMLELREQLQAVSAEAKRTQEELVEAKKVQLPQRRRSLFREVLGSPKKVLRASIIRHEIKQENHAAETKFLRDRLVTADREAELEQEAKVFGSERHADRVVSDLISKINT